MPRRINPLNYVGIRPAPGAIMPAPQHPAADQPGLAPVANVDQVWVDEAPRIQEVRADYGLRPGQIWPDVNAAANYRVYNIPAPRPIDPYRYVGGHIGAEMQPADVIQPIPAAPQPPQDVAEAFPAYPPPNRDRVRPENRDFDPKVWNEIHNLTKEVMELKKTIALLQEQSKEDYWRKT